MILLSFFVGKLLAKILDESSYVPRVCAIIKKKNNLSNHDVISRNYLNNKLKPYGISTIDANLRNVD